MIWLDVVIAAMIVGMAALEAKRGFGRAVFDCGAIMIALGVAPKMHIPLAHHLDVLRSPQANSAFIYTAVVVVSGAVLWLVAKTAYESTQLSLDHFEIPLGAVVGIVIGAALAHALTTTIFISTNHGGYLPASLANSALGKELYGFYTYNSVIGFLKGLTN